VAEGRKAGQLIQRGDRRWMVRVYLGVDPKTNRRRYYNRFIRGSKKDAQRFLNGVLRDNDLGAFVEPSEQTLGDYLTEWLETAARPRLGDRTFQEYTNLLRRYVRPGLDSYLLCRVEPLVIQNLYAKMLDRGLSARTVRYVHAVLNSALKQAVKWRKLARNPAQFVDLPRQKRKEMKSLTRAETTAFLKACGADRYGLVFCFALGTGMRTSEYLALQWKDVDLEAGRVQVRRALVRLKGAWSFAETKTSRSRRTIPLPASIVRQLARHRVEQASERLKAGAEYANLDLVFATRTGLPISAHNLLHQNFKPILERAGLPRTIRLYDLRHTHATMLMDAEENPKVVSERLGHASITLTLDTYTHVLPHMQQRAAERLEKLMFG
jgi:integrase